MEYKYNRVAANDSSWLRPTGGRLGKSGDYVGSVGFAHEDWNFSGDVWIDGKCHLYVQGEPARSDRSKEFAILLGVYDRAGHVAIGYCERATYATSDLPKQLKMRRAKHLHHLDVAGHLAGPLKGLNVADKAENLFNDGENYWICVDQANLRILAEPIPIKPDVVKPSYKRYGLIGITKTEFERIKNLADDAERDSVLAKEGQTFSEGRLIERLHLVRERDETVIAEAKKRFLRLHGHFFCEICGWKKEESFKALPGHKMLLEAHHDVPLGSLEHTGQTIVDDIRFLCPTCHRAIHSLGFAIKVNDFKKKYLL